MNIFNIELECSETSKFLDWLAKKVITVGMQMKSYNDYKIITYSHIR